MKRPNRPTAPSVETLYVASQTDEERVVIALLRGLGLSPWDAVRLRCRDVDVDTAPATLVNRGVVLVLPADVCLVLSQHLQFQGLAGDDALLGCSGEDLRNAVHAIGQRLGVPLSAHGLRRAYIAERWASR